MAEPAAQTFSDLGVGRNFRWQYVRHRWKRELVPKRIEVSMFSHGEMLSLFGLTAVQAAIFTKLLLHYPGIGIIPALVIGCVAAFPMSCIEMYGLSIIADRYK